MLTPRFSPSTQEITYMEFGQGDPRVYLFNIETGQREIVGNFPGMSFSPRFSPDGQRVIMSLQQGGNSNLFVMDLRSKSTTRLTDTPAIDTSPSYSPDGARICFESDRGVVAWRTCRRAGTVPAAPGVAAGPVQGPRFRGDDAVTLASADVPTDISPAGSSPATYARPGCCRSRAPVPADGSCGR